MSLFKGLSKEFQVGSLTAIAITILILGYNFMRGKDNPFKSGKDLTVFYDSTPGLGIGTSVMFNGLRIGQLTKLDITDGHKIEAIFEISSKMEIPKDSKMKIETEIFGGQKVRLVLGKSTEFAQDGDTLIPMYAEDKFSAINDQIVPLASKADSLLTSMNSFFKSESLNLAIDRLPLAVQQINLLLQQTQSLLAANKEVVTHTIGNVDRFSNNFVQYHQRINNLLIKLDSSTSGLDEVSLKHTVMEIDSLTKELNKITIQINSGNGTVGKMIYSDSLYNALNKSSNELNKVLLDLKKYPEKYIPIPGTKNQRKKAKELSLKDSEIWN
jgi:phospholipid/cholesterol/gamma-HCH transport system substrate-binding protein